MKDLKVQKEERAEGGEAIRFMLAGAPWLPEQQQGGFHAAQPTLLPLPGDGKHEALLTAIDSALELQRFPEGGSVLQMAERDREEMKIPE